MDVTSSNTYTLTVTNENGCKASDDITVLFDNATAISKQQKQEISVFPNPNNGDFTIGLNEASDKEKHIQLVDTKGYVVKQQTTTATNIKMENVKPGLYLLIIQEGSHIHRLKVVVQ
ncbi:T9SS C-terminal target domain-containing protein [Marinilabiliaceae bacterium JC017]|nr:T9SS C-terminal target domain-containing protein [Marinilabiliaceae bacterium JC017]